MATWKNRHECRARAYQWHPRSVARRVDKSKPDRSVHHRLSDRMPSLAWHLVSHQSPGRLFRFDGPNRSTPDPALMGPRSAQDRLHCLKQNTKIERQRPLIDVLHVELQRPLIDVRSEEHTSELQ